MSKPAANDAALEPVRRPDGRTSFPVPEPGPAAEKPGFGPVTRPTLPTNSAAGRTHFRTSVIRPDRPGDPSVFGEKTRAEAQELISRYPADRSRSALLPLLHLVQSEQGYLTPDGIAFCADLLGLTKAEVSGVASYYTMYKRRPTGEYLVSVCTNTLCGLLGGDEIYATLRERLGVEDEETTPDGAITIEHAECLAACDYAPVVTVNYEFFDNQTVDSACDLVDRLRAGERPMPTRGAPLCSFKQIERQIAGFFDDGDAFAPEANASGGPTEAGVRLAIERGDTAPSYAVEQPTQPAPEATKRARKQPGRTTRRKAAADQQPTSQHDAPLETSASDEAHPAKPAGEEAQ